MPAVTGALEADEKTCPDCAETIRREAKVCRHCGFRFDGSVPQAAPTAPVSTKSPPGALALGIVLSGLGNFYVGEVTRGLVILASGLLFVVAASIGSGSGAAFAVLLLIVSAADAYQGAKNLNLTGSIRPVSGGLWVLLAGMILLVAIVGSMSG
jgi:hypothetical protein